MSRYLRYLLIWLSCTAVSVTAVVLTVHFVVGSTKPKPPVARSLPTVFPSPSAPSSAPASPSEKPSASPSTSRPAQNVATTRPTPRASATPKPAPTSPTASPGLPGCSEGGAGVHTIRSTGGRASVRFGEGGVCLVSAVPTQGFTVRTSQQTATTLTVTFSADRHKSEIIATTEPRSGAEVRETSW